MIIILLKSYLRTIILFLLKSSLAVSSVNDMSELIDTMSSCKSVSIDVSFIIGFFVDDKLEIVIIKLVIIVASDRINKIKKIIKRINCHIQSDTIADNITSC